jgi:uncharacterized protein involved in tolerance to divalent cations
VSVVQFTVENKEKAEALTSKLLSQYLIADSQIINNNYERSFMKYKKMVQMDGQVKAKFITTDDKVPDLVRFIENNNPNDKNTEIPSDLMATNLNSGSTEYVQWVKDQLSQLPKGDEAKAEDEE